MVCACDLPVTGTGRSWHHWNAFGSNLSFVEAASDALRSNCTHLSVIHVDALKIRRCLAPWGFNSPSRHHDFIPVIRSLEFEWCFERSRTPGEIRSTVVEL